MPGILNSKWGLPSGPQGPFAIFLLAGQSNHMYGESIDTSLDGSGGSVFQWGRNGSDNNKVVDGSEPLQHADFQASRIGHAVAFARDYYIPNRGGRVLLVPCAVGGTSINDWAIGGSLYVDAIGRTNNALGANPGSILKGVIWDQGERDHTLGTDPSTYQSAQDAVLTQMRVDLVTGTNLPIVVTGMVPAWIAGNSNGLAIQAAISGTPGRLTKTAYVDPSTPTILTGLNPSEPYHYSAIAQRGGLAQRTYNAWASI